MTKTTRIRRKIQNKDRQKFGSESLDKFCLADMYPTGYVSVFVCGNYVKKEYFMWVWINMGSVAVCLGEVEDLVRSTRWCKWNAIPEKEQF